MALWLDVLDETIRACAGYRRADLANRLRRKRAQLLDPRLRVLVVGEPKRGKSQLVNALIGAPVCAVGDDVTTALPTVVEHADEPRAALVTSPLPAAHLAITGGVSAADRTPVPIERIADRTGRPAGAGLRGEFVYAEVGIPRALLASGLVLIDTPAIGGTDPVRSAYTYAALGAADVVLLVADAAAGLSDAELDFLRYAVRLCPYLLVVLGKTDLCPQWRDTADRDRDRLAAAGLPATLLAVSAALRLHAARAGDQALNAESGFPELIDCLRRDALGKGERIAPTAAAVAAGLAVEELAAPLAAEPDDPDESPATDALAELRAAQRRFDELRRHSARWQNMLSDEIADLVSDVEYDLRDRTRKILRKVEDYFDQADPRTVWDTFTPWLDDNLLDAAESNFRWLVERSHWIARRIAAGFPATPGGVLPDSTFWIPEVFESMPQLDAPAVGEFTVGQKVFTGLRGSYGGLVMFGLVTSLAGLPLINVVSLGAGALFGGKTLRDEGENRLQRRQAAAKHAVQRHVEDFFVKFSKDCKDVARQVHRSLRDHFTALAEDLQEDLVESARVAKQAADSEAVLRERRAVEQHRELEGLRALHGKVQGLVGPVPAIPRQRTARSLVA
jgi:Dynamin family